MCPQVLLKKKLSRRDFPGLGWFLGEGRKEKAQSMPDFDSFLFCFRKLITSCRILTMERTLGVTVMTIWMRLYTEEGP